MNAFLAWDRTSFARVALMTVLLGLWLMVGVSSLLILTTDLPAELLAFMWSIPALSVPVCTAALVGTGLAMPGLFSYENTAPWKVVAGWVGTIIAIPTTATLVLVIMAAQHVPL